MVTFVRRYSPLALVVASLVALNAVGVHVATPYAVLLGMVAMFLGMALATEADAAP